MTEQQRRAKALELFQDQQLQQVMGNLWARWQNEREYEDINDYAKPIKPFVELIGGEFVGMTKRPFGFKYKLAGATYQVKMTARQYDYKRIA